MRFKAKKEYGHYKSEQCPFCSRVATLKNEQGIAVCRLHLKENVGDRKCLCGKWLELCSGKFGPYFSCPNCGNLSYDKGMARSTVISVKEQEQLKKKPLLRSSLSEEKEIVISSRDVEYFD